MDNSSEQKHKLHNISHSGKKAEKKKAKTLNKEDLKERKRNPKAFAIQSAVKAERQFRHKQDKLEKKYHIPRVDRTPVDHPPIVVSVVGPQQVGKSTLIRNLVRHFSGKNINEIKGPITVVAGRNKRFTFIECNSDINNMIDLAKISDISLLLIDAYYGFEMETFEYLNICKAHGEHRIMGILTHLDQFNKFSQMKKAKKDLKRRFWTEVYAGAKLFYLSRIAGGKDYVQTEIKNLSRFLTVIKLQPVEFKTSHPYMLVDRFEDLTNLEEIKKNELCDRNIVLYGYSRGSYFKPNQMIHIFGCGDMVIDNISFISDPCPIPEKVSSKRKLLSLKDKLVYSPFSGVQGILYDKDAVYIDIGTSHFHRDNTTSMVFDKLTKTDKTIDKKISETSVQLFSNNKYEENKLLNHNLNSEINEIINFKNESIKKNNSSLDEFESFDKEENSFNLEDDDVEYNEEDEEGGDFEDEEGDDFDDEESDDDNLENENNNFKKLSFQNNFFEDNEKNIEENYSFDDDSDDEKDDNIFNTNNNIVIKSQNYNYLDSSKSIQNFVYRNLIETDIKKNILLNSLESTKLFFEKINNWKDEDVCNTIKDCFVTGKWTDRENAEILLKYDDDDELDEFGNFGNMEVNNEGENNYDKKIENLNSDEDYVDNSNDENEKIKRLEKKRKLKEEFNINYDSKDIKKRKNEEVEDEGPEEAKFYREMKAKLEKQAQLNKSEFENLSDELRVNYEGYRPGMYIRIQIKSMPGEFVKNFNPHYPIIVGGLLSGETNLGYLQVRIKKHRWYPKILKSKNPLIISLGWRRFQTLPIYSIQDHNGRDRCLKYTPQHLHCFATFYGPITPQKTGFVAIQDYFEGRNKFRIAANGIVLNLDKSFNLVKKLKIVGHPLKIFKKTAFVQGMFNSVLEATKFEGAIVKTVSGIRGHIKKAISKPEGAFRASFEDKILMSDIVFMRTWSTIDIPKFYYPVCSLLLNNDMKMKWQGMKTVGQLRYENNTSAPQKQDSFYTIMERKKFTFKNLELPKNLEKELPYKSKVKMMAKKENKIQRVTVVREPQEQKIVNLQKRIHAMYIEGKKLDKQKSLSKAEKNRKAVKLIMNKKLESIRKKKKAINKKLSLKKGKK